MSLAVGELHDRETDCRFKDLSLRLTGVSLRTRFDTSTEEAQPKLPPKRTYKSNRQALAVIQMQSKVDAMECQAGTWRLGTVVET